MTDLADEQGPADAVTALLEAALAGITGAVLYEYEEAEKVSALPAQYVLWTLSRRLGGEQRVCVGVGTVPWRLSTRVVARTSKGARALRTAVNTIERQRITANGATSTPILFESADDIGPDNGFLSGLQTWTFAL